MPPAADRMHVARDRIAERSARPPGVTRSARNGTRRHPVVTNDLCVRRASAPRWPTLQRRRTLSASTRGAAPAGPCGAYR
jgi:hypothetical protein